MRETVDGLTGTDQSDPYDVAKAAQLLVEELEVLAQRPATEATLLLVEYAARRFDGCAARLVNGDGENDIEEIGAGLRAVHVRLCLELRPDPDALIDRLVEIVDAADAVSCLDQPTDYLPVLGPDGVAALTD